METAASERLFDIKSGKNLIEFLWPLEDIRPVTVCVEYIDGPIFRQREIDIQHGLGAECRIAQRDCRQGVVTGGNDICGVIEPGRIKVAEDIGGKLAIETVDPR